MSNSDSSSLSSAPPTDDEADKVIAAKINKPKGINKYFKPATKGENVHVSPPPPKRAPSPVHEYVLADNPDIAFLVMFRARFHDAFPRSVPNLGPQDIENAITDTHPGEMVERLLCGLLGLVLNRKKEVERAHYGRALEDAIGSHSGQWTGGKDFNAMGATERLKFLRTLVLWALSDSEAVQAIIKDSYKSSRQTEDRNVGLAVVPWFVDTFSKRKYYLVEGKEDTYFRLYRENNAISQKTNTWFSVAGDIEEINTVAERFDAETASQSKAIAMKLKAAIPRFEAGEDKRKRREYRLSRKAAFSKPEPGFSLYEGRTRGKRMKYTFSDDEIDSDGLSIHRSARNSGVSTPFEDRGPTITASGRQVKSRYAGLYGESMLVDKRREIDNEEGVEVNGDPEQDTIEVSGSGAPNGHARGGGKESRGARRSKGYTQEAQSDDESDAPPTEEEWTGNEEESDDDEPELDDDDEEMSDADSTNAANEIDENTQESLVVQLRYRKTDQDKGETVQVTTNGYLPYHDFKDRNQPLLSSSPLPQTIHARQEPQHAEGLVKEPLKEVLPTSGDSMTEDDLHVPKNLMHERVGLPMMSG